MHLLFEEREDADQLVAPEDPLGEERKAGMLLRNLHEVPSVEEAAGDTLVYERIPGIRVVDKPRCHPLAPCSGGCAGSARVSVGGYIYISPEGAGIHRTPGPLPPGGGGSVESQRSSRPGHHINCVFGADAKPGMLTVPED